MRTLVIKVVSGSEDPERCAQAFSVAAAALAMGAEVSLWLAGDAAWFAVPGKAEEFVVEQGPDFAAIRDQLLAAGNLNLCTQCANRRGITPELVLPGVRLAGAAAFAEAILGEQVQALVY